VELFNKNHTAIILSGGKSLRMGEDKGLMKIEGKPMIKYVIETVEQLTKQIMIIANNKAYQIFHYPVYKDSIKDKGPLGGIVEGLSRSTSDFNWVLSCDTPYLEQGLLTDLMLELKKENQAVIVEHSNRKHPLIAVYHRSSLPVFEKQLDQNDLKLSNALNKLKMKTLNIDHLDKKIVANINSKKDL